MILFLRGWNEPPPMVFHVFSVRRTDLTIGMLGADWAISKAEMELKRLFMADHLGWAFYLEVSWESNE